MLRKSVLVVMVFVAIVRPGFAEVHRFEPKVFYTTFSGAHPPALRLKPGDSVITSTIDAGGIDSSGTQRAPAPNPEIGPFYIEGAERGDTLVVHLLRLETNRSTGFSNSLLAPYTIDPVFLRSEASREAKRVTWHIDKEKGIVYIDPGEYKGSRIELPLRPMLGCIGTAPANNAAIPSQYPDNFGGNMDYNGMGAGVTVMLPVFDRGRCSFWETVTRGREMGKSSVPQSRPPSTSSFQSTSSKRKPSTGRDWRIRTLSWCWEALAR